MNGLTTGETAIAMREIAMGKDARTTSVNLDDVEKLKDFEELVWEMRDIVAKGGMINLSSDWLGKE